MGNQVRVLVVEDESIMRSIIGYALKELGCDVVGEALDGEQALELFVQMKPDLVLLDIHLPRRDGIEVLRKMREAQRDAYIVMLTAMSDEGTIEDCLLAGARDYLRKDRPSEELASRLTRHVNRLKG